MIKKLLIAWCIAAGYSLPAFADTTEPPAAANPAYLFQLSYTDAEQAIGKALAEKGAGSKIAAFINGRQSEALFSYKDPITIEIRGLTFDTPSKHWNASLLAVAGSVTVTALPVSGRFEEMVSVPVLKREIKNGDVIGENDIEMRDFPLAHTRTDTVTDTAALIGKSPARTISAFRQIRDHEIGSPAIIKKNALVQMRYSSPGMEITATGQAESEGAKGDVISVRNTASHKVVRAVVEDANTVSILIPGAAQASQLTEAAHATN